MMRSRRNLLCRAGTVAVAVGATATAGCLDATAGDGPQGPEGTPETLSCPDEAFVRLEAPFEDPVESRIVETDGEGGGGTRLELSAEGTAETYGQAIRLVLRNTGDGPAETHGEYAYSIQRRTDEGWLDVRGSTSSGPVDLPREDDTLEAGDTYDWSIDLEESAISAAVPGRELTVCPPLGAGAHRFVYWGALEAPPIGMEFELVG
ncbi:hypothetical protein DQW50_11370 [Halorubrum sp. 48-1-W]|uniref:hypothetical protein n=1 Tax=Halorubrum sp. 48-1-W TaxID=2249761 RepID=UPI000DCD4888|nr:hypothetical protein [Halorubrum sp. 48-1-W]RAW45066.1 hypothetical protein DQW50_11370 [Halorubrum sp. 48-1-W]